MFAEGNRMSRDHVDDHAGDVCGATHTRDLLADKRLSLALMLVRHAGRDALARRAKATVAWKSPGDLVTDADAALQSWIVQQVRTQFPEDWMIAEEARGAWASQAEFVWIVDPLDGTNNYAVGIPCFAVSVGIFRRGLRMRVRSTIRIRV